MTAQISDSFQYRDEDYAVVCIENKWPFIPSKYGLEPVTIHTACWRGYYCHYLIKNKKIVLVEMTIGLKTDEKRLLEGYLPEKLSQDGGGVPSIWRYEEMSVPIEYTGGLIIGKDFIASEYVHMGFHRAHCYRNVVELIFDNGVLSQEINHSSKLEEFRSKANANEKKYGFEDIPKLFSLNYEDKWDTY